ncbi:MAG TPA: cyclic dehypoxanthinyl futalosine synthase [Verrucomicrobiota bacterium]|nr:cyclic dehypoxanthinyl futalosine synthase [Verrucomicrobiota bacterium]HNU53310.1 cyclic dehypoxanthinyl futalosine synthase [Verrucomicrobiota bacterium]
MTGEGPSDALLDRVWSGARVSPAEARGLYDLPLGTLGALAHRRRGLAKQAAYGGRGNEIVTYQVDRNINYTNVCAVRCRFCAFHRAEGDTDAYVITREELDRKIEETIALGGTQILLQGGHHPTLPKSWYLDLLTHVKSRFPSVNIHGFSPSEFIHFRNLFQQPLEQILLEFQQAGLGSLPGGGAEILVDRVRKQISPLKAMTEDWLEVMAIAHRLGLRSSATMMFGHVETVEDRIEHLDRLRQLQDQTRGFTAFIGWTFQPENTRLDIPAAGAEAYLRTQALARIYLDNFDNIQSSWVTQGPAIGQIALTFGANDLGSIMIEENVVAQAGATFRMTIADMHRLIRDLGCEPRQRDNWYRLIDPVGPAAPAATPPTPKADSPARPS